MASKKRKNIGSGKYLTSSQFSHEVTEAMLLYRTIAKIFFGEFGSSIMQNVSDILPFFYTATWPSHKVSENQEDCLASSTYSCFRDVSPEKTSSGSRVIALSQRNLELKRC